MVPDSALSYQPPPRFQQNQTYLNSAQSSSSRGEDFLYLSVVLDLNYKF